MPNVAENILPKLGQDTNGVQSVMQAAPSQRAIQICEAVAIASGASDTFEVDLTGMERPVLLIAAQSADTLQPTVTIKADAAYDATLDQWYRLYSEGGTPAEVLLWVKQCASAAGTERWACQIGAHGLGYTRLEVSVTTANLAGISLYVVGA